MTHGELRQAAIDYLARAFQSSNVEQAAVQPHVIGAAVSIVLSPEPKKAAKR